MTPCVHGRRRVARRRVARRCHERSTGPSTGDVRPVVRTGRLGKAVAHQDAPERGAAMQAHDGSSRLLRRPTDRLDPLLLAGAIETYRYRQGGPDIPSYLEATYRAALARAAQLTVEALEQERDEDAYGGLLAALAAFQGHPRLAAGNPERCNRSGFAPALPKRSCYRQLLQLPAAAPRALMRAAQPCDQDHRHRQPELSSVRP